MVTLRNIPRTNIEVAKLEILGLIHNITVMICIFADHQHEEHQYKGIGPDKQFERIFWIVFENSDKFSHLHCEIVDGRTRR